MARYKLQDIDKDLMEMLRFETSEKRRAQIAADVARSELKAAQDHNRNQLGVLPDHKHFVNGVQGAPFESIRRDGAIVIEFELYDHMFKEIGDLLILNSPVGKLSDKRPGHPGLYRGSHIFLADGKPVPPGAPTPAAEEYVFVNAVAYARKIEKGLSQEQAPKGVYEETAKMAEKRFGNLAYINFNFRDLYFGQVDAWASTTSMQPRTRSPRARDRADWLRRQPAIIINPR